MRCSFNCVRRLLQLPSFHLTLALWFVTFFRLFYFTFTRRAAIPPEVILSLFRPTSALPCTSLFSSYEPWKMGLNWLRFRKVAMAIFRVPVLIKPSHPGWKFLKRKEQQSEIILLWRCGHFAFFLKSGFLVEADFCELDRVCSTMVLFSSICKIFHSYPAHEQKYNSTIF